MFAFHPYCGIRVDVGEGDREKEPLEGTEEMGENRLPVSI
jgi:hypothetical protein